MDTTNSTDEESNKHVAKHCPCICHQKFDPLNECILVTRIGAKEGPGFVDEYKEFSSGDDLDISRWFQHPYEHCYEHPKPRIKQVEFTEPIQDAHIPIGLEAIIYQREICRCGFRKHLLEAMPSFPLSNDISISTRFDYHWFKERHDNSLITYNSDLKRSFHCCCSPLPSPYEHRLLLKRLEELKDEEESLLKMRRLMEHQRLRDPVTKWYEGKDKHFHDESHFNTFSLKYPKMWKEFVKVRQDTLSLLLDDVSKEYHDGFRRYRLISQNSV